MDFQKWIRDNISSILTGIGGIGTIATVVLAVKATPNAYLKISTRKEMKNRECDDETSKISVSEAIGLCWKDYIPTLAVGISSLCCIAGANILSRKQQASLASAYTALAGTFSAYRDKISMMFGKEADEVIMRSIEDDKEAGQEENPPWDENQIFYLECCGKPKFFEKTMLDVQRAEYLINRNFRLKGRVSLNEFLAFLDQQPVENGDEIGWDKYIGETEYGYQWIDFTPRYYITDDGLTVCSIDMDFPPHSFEEDDYIDTVPTCGVD